MIPYLLALNFAEGEDDSRVGRGRGVAFAVAQLSSGRTVFATCKHNLINKSSFLIFDERGNGLGIEGGKMVMLTSTCDDLDLVLFVLPIVVSMDRIRLSPQPISPKTLLSHAQNAFLPDAQNCPTFIFTTKETAKSEERAICSIGAGIYEFVNNEIEARGALCAGRRTFYGVLHMGSRPGVSGSPLWDKYGTIRGMVCGGNSESDQSPKLIYLPVRQIEAELKILLRNEKMMRK